MMKQTIRTLTTAVMLVLVSSVSVVGTAAADGAAEINIKVDGMLTLFKKEVNGGAEFLNKAKAVLVFPDIVKAGLVVGGEYGKGALRQSGKTLAYYNIASASFGFQIGAQSYAVVMVFMNDDALKKFRDSKGWEAGVDGSVALADWGSGKDINTQNYVDPIVGFVLDNKGLMAGLSLEGSKISKIDP
jgi:lipid-binding SYLF domain-containing protein